MSQSTTVLYRVPTPYSMGDATIEVYGDPENGWYEWRVVDAGGKTLQDSKCQGYGSAEIALRDALIETSKE